MDRIRAAEFFDKQVKERFPDWTPTRVLIEDWLEWLRPFDYDIAERAIRQHRFESRYKSPILKDFYTMAKSFQQTQATGQMQKKSDPILAYSLKQYSNGVVKKFYITNPKEMVNPQIISEWALKMAVKYSKMYGGDWAIIQDWETIQQ